MKKKIVVGTHTTFRKWCAANRHNPIEYINVINATSAHGYSANGDVDESLILLYDCDPEAVEILEAHGFTQKKLAQKGCERDTDSDSNCDRHPNGCPAKPKTRRTAAAHRPRTVRERTAILIKPINGAFTRWKAGEQVKVSVTGARYCLIKKMKQQPSGIFREGLPLLNELAGVPIAFLKFSKNQFKT